MRALRGSVLNQLIARQHQLAYQVHQLVQQMNIDANGGVGKRRRSGHALFALCFRLDRQCFHGLKCWLRCRSWNFRLGCDHSSHNFRRLLRQRRGLATIGGFETLAQIRIGVVALLSGCFDVGEDGFDGVDRLEDERGHLRSELALAVAQLAQDIFRDMRDAAQLVEAEEARRSLDGVHGAEDIGQQRGVVGTLFELHQLAIEIGQVLAALDQKFPYVFV